MEGLQKNVKIDKMKTPTLVIQNSTFFNTFQILLISLVIF